MTTNAQSKLETLRRKVAEAEAVLQGLKAKLAAAEAKGSGMPPPPTGLDLLWAAALPQSRERSSRHKCRVAWNRIPVNERPPISVAVEALKAWNRSDGWKAENHRFAPGLQRFIAERMWEDLPESAKDRKPFSPYRAVSSARPPAAGKESEAVTDPAEIKRILRMRS